MLSDHARTLSYRDVLQRHTPRKVVAEIGCGSGVLSCFAARAGARHVFAIEETTMIEVAREIAERNGLAKQITFIAGNSLNVDLPKRVDVVFSELIGSDPLGEAMLPVLADARERFLRPAGVMIPRALSIWTVGIESPSIGHAEYLLEQKRRAAEELGDGYGVDLAPLLDLYRVELVTKQQLLSYQPHVGDFVGYEAAETRGENPH